MRAKTRRKLEMGQRVLEFCRQHPNLGPALTAAADRLKERLEKAAELASRQLDGRSEVHAATTRKIELRRLIMQAPLDHLASVAQFAAAEDPDVIQKFTYPPDATTYLAFRAAATGMAAEAESRKELLLRHGLSEEILAGLQTSLEQFQTAVEQGAAGRVAGVSSTAELNEVAEEVVQEVKVMNGQVRFRFAGQPEVLVAWESASNVFAAPKPEDKPATGGTSIGGTPPTGDVRPAA